MAWALPGGYAIPPPDYWQGDSIGNVRDASKPEFERDFRRM